MARRPCRNHSLIFKAKVTLAAIKGDNTSVEPCEQFDILANRPNQWITSFRQWATEAQESPG